MIPHLTLYIKNIKI